MGRQSLALHSSSAASRCSGDIASEAGAWLPSSCPGRAPACCSRGSGPLGIQIFPTEDRLDLGKPLRSVNIAKAKECDQPLTTLVYARPIELERLMFPTGAGSRTTSRAERHGRRAIRMRTIIVTAAIAAVVVSAIVITPPAFSNTGGGGQVSGSGPRQPSYSSNRAPNANVSGAHYLNGAGSARQPSNSGGREGWHNGGAPPGWTGHGEMRGWDGGKMPPGLSRRDHDRDWRDRKFDRGEESSDRDRGQFHTGQLERRWVGDFGYQ